MIPINDVQFVHDIKDRDRLAVEGWREIPSDLDYWIMVHPVPERPKRKKAERARDR